MVWISWQRSQLAPARFQPAPPEITADAFDGAARQGGGFQQAFPRVMLSTFRFLQKEQGKKIIFLTRILGWKGFFWPGTETWPSWFCFPTEGPAVSTRFVGSHSLQVLHVQFTALPPSAEHLPSHPWSIFMEEASPNSLPNQTCIRLHVSIPGKDSNLASNPRAAHCQKARGAAGVSPFFATNPLVPLSPINKAAN